MKAYRDEYKMHQSRITACVHGLPVRGHTVNHAAYLSRKACQAETRGAGLWVTVCFLLAVSATALAVV